MLADQSALSSTYKLCAARHTITIALAMYANLTNHFLIAMPNMVDPNFSKSLTYICEHTDKGALGIVVNRPSDITLGTLLGKADITLDNDKWKSVPIYNGGPVQTERGFVLHRPVGAWQSTLAVNEVAGLTTSRDVLLSMVAGKGPEKMLVALGYAGWSAGQLEQEIKQNGWLTVEADLDVVFNMPAEARLNAAMGLLGISFANLSGQAGHA
jgi:putative transcriptional regulator